MGLLEHFLFIPLFVIIWIGKLLVDIAINFWWAFLAWYIWALYKHHTM